MLLSVSGFLFKDGKVLIVKRSEAEEFLREHYELPGGGAEKGESPEEAVVREFMEETGLRVKPSKLVHEFLWKTDKGYDVTDQTYILESLDQYAEVKLSSEHTEYRWAKESDLESLLVSERMLGAIKAGFRHQETISSSLL